MSQDLFEISEIVPDFDSYIEDYRASSNATRRTLRNQLDVAYGDAPAQRLDLFFPPGEAVGLPVHMFIHGGYWRAQVKEDYAFVADGIVAAGAIAAVVEYTLIPHVRMSEQVRQLREAAAWLAANAAMFGGDGSRLTASGHSAGGHLVTWLAARSRHELGLPQTGVKAVMPVSGIFDLRPITTSYLQPELNLTPEDVAEWSPIEAAADPAVPVEIVVGHEETAPFHQQAQDYAHVLAGQKVPHERISAAGRNHMSVVRDLGRPGSQVWSLLDEMIGR
jgi:arylformamidase